MAPKKIAPKPAIMRHASVRHAPSIVEEAIKKVNKAAKIHDLDDPPAELIRKLSEFQGEEVTGQRFNGWRKRGVFPVEFLEVVSYISGVSLVRLVHYSSFAYPDKEFDSVNPA